MGVAWVLGVSILLQFAAAVIALRLISITGRRQAWLLISAAITLMAVRRCFAFFRVVSGDVKHSPDLPAEIIALVISVLMVAGLGAIAPLFLGIRRTESEKLAAHRRALRHQDAIVTLATNASVINGDFERATREITEAAAEALEVERSSIWLLSDDQQKLRCVDLFERTPKQHSSGVVLEAAEYPRYFQALQNDRAIDAHDARTDPRTSEFLGRYLAPNSITSMLDAAIRLSGDTIGIVCNEHVGKPRTWSTDDTTFAGEIADQAAQVLMNNQRMQAERALRESESRLRQIINLVPHGIFAKDRKGHFVLANHALAEAYGTTVEALVHASEGASIASVKEPDQFLKDDQEVIDSGQPMFIPEESFVDALGRTRFLQTTKISFTLSGDAEPAVLGVSVDITEQKHARDLQAGRNKVLERLATGASLEEVLTILVQTLERLRPGLRGSVLFLDKEQQRLRHGAAPSLPDFYIKAIDGLKIGEGVGSCGTAAFRGERVIVADVMKHPFWSQYRELATKTDFRACWSEPIIASTGEILGTFAMYYRDPQEPDEWDLENIKSAAHLAGIAIERRLVEKEKRIAQEKLLEHQQRERERVEAELAKVRDKLVRSTRLATIGQMSAQVAHDIRNPLGSIRNAAYYLKRKVPADETKLRNYLDLIDQEVGVCDEIIGGMLELTWYREPKFETIELGPMVDEAVVRLNFPKTVKVRQCYDQKPFLMSIDPVRFRRVIDNLLKNALDAVRNGQGDGGEIVIDASHGEKWDRIEIHDSGPGIPAQKGDEVFELFYTTKAKGTGLGLAICRQIVERHGGTIGILNEDRHGATFRIELPKIKSRSTDLR